MLQWFQFECYKYLEIILRRQNSACVANIWVPSLQTFYLNCVTPLASRAAGGHGGKHRNLPIFASARFSSSPSSIFLPHHKFFFFSFFDIFARYWHNIHSSLLPPTGFSKPWGFLSFMSEVHHDHIFLPSCPFSSFYRAKCNMVRSFVTDKNASHCSKLCFSRILVISSDCYEVEQMNTLPFTQKVIGPILAFENFQSQEKQSSGGKNVG